MWILVSLRNNDGDGNEYGKKAIDLDKQNNDFARASRFCRGREQTDNNFLFLFLNFDAVL